MNPKLMAWALGLSLAANVAAVAFWPRVRESEAGNAPPVGRFTFIHAPNAYMRGDTVTGQLIMTGLADGKMQSVEVISARYPTSTGALPLREP